MLSDIMILDCACGLNPVENTRDFTVHVDIERTYLGKKNAADNIVDAHHLPFKNNSFDIVYSAHTLEHCQHPLIVLREFRRVAPLLVIKVPNATYNRGGLNEDDGHLYSWTSKSFYQLLKQVYPNVNLKMRKHWKIRGYTRVKGGLAGFWMKQLAIFKTFIFILAAGEPNELEAVCS